MHYVEGVKVVKIGGVIVGIDKVKSKLDGYRRSGLIF